MRCLIVFTLLAGCGPALLLDAAVGAAVGDPKPSSATEQASAAANAGDCATTRSIANDLRVREGGTIHDVTFLNDPAIQRCFLAPP